MIITVCLNPSFDRTVTLDSLRIGNVNRAVSSRTDPGGKGINVALLLDRLGIDARCIWAAPDDGREQMTDLLNRAGLQHLPISVSGAIRTNTKLVSKEGTTDINESGAVMDAQALSGFIEACVREAHGSRFAVLTGSLPPGCPEGTYARMIGGINVPAVLDVSGKELMLGLSAHPFLIKPNRDELSAAVGSTLATDREVYKAANFMRSLGAQNVLVSLGDDGAMLLTGEKVYRGKAPSVRVRSTVGAGDSMVAGMLCGLEEKGNLKDAFAYGIAAGSKAVTMEGTQPFDRTDFLPLLSQVEIQEVSLT